MENGLVQFKQHFDDEISQEIIDYVNNDVLLDSRYIFIKRAAGVQFGYCTHCRNTFQSGSLKHNDISKCLRCHSSCVVKGHGIGRKYLCDSGYVVYYEKSKVNPNVIVARGFYVSRNYSGAYKDLDTKFIIRAMYVFEIGNPQMYENHYWSNKIDLRKRQSVISHQHTSDYANDCCPLFSIKAAIQNTPFQYSTWDQHDTPQFDYVKFFALYCKYPLIEYLTKLGFSSFVHAKLYGLKTFSCINWNGKGIEKILRLNKQQIKEVRESELDIDPMTLRLYQISRKDANKPNLQDIQSFFYQTGDCMEILKPILAHANVGQIMNYVIKQMNRKEKQKFSGENETLTSWRDYIGECKHLEYDLNNERIVFPSNLYAAHQKTMKLVTHKQNADLDIKIENRMTLLKRYCFENEDLLIRPAASTWELINEGRLLNICVGDYAERYADAKTNILLIRHKTRTDIPHYTLEVRDNNVIQVQGLKHCKPTEIVQQFIEQFKAEKLTKKQNKKAVAV